MMCVEMAISTFLLFTKHGMPCVAHSCIDAQMLDPMIVKVHTLFYTVVAGASIYLWLRPRPLV
jgi:hypothetical protein